MSGLWEELKTLLMKRFQPRTLTATRAQFRSRRRCQMEDIYPYVETLQHLAYIAWPFMDYHTKEEMVIDQFLLGIGNHELSVQVVAHGHRRVEDILWVARSLTGGCPRGGKASHPKAQTQQPRTLCCKRTWSDMRHQAIGEGHVGTSQLRW